MRPLKLQRGMTLLSVCMLLGLIAFFTLLILKIGPIYLDHYKVKTAVTELEDDSAILRKSALGIKASLLARLNINAVTSVTKHDIKVYKQADYVKVTVDYEVTRNILGNLDVLVYFNDEIEVTNR